MASTGSRCCSVIGKMERDDMLSAFIPFEYGAGKRYALFPVFFNDLGHSVKIRLFVADIDGLDEHRQVAPEMTSTRPSSRKE
jgi:hypothetical protein